MTQSSIDGLFDQHDALGVAELVRRREVSAEETIAAGLARIRRVEPQLQALSRVADGLPGCAADGPFVGVPFLVKELMADCAGWPTTVGSAFFAEAAPAKADSAAVARMRRAGLAIVGRTKTSEFGIAPTTEPRFGGPVHNPWDLTLSPGGSSGGSAALVAARAVPMAHATDGGGSIRMPAALTGLFGLKPSRGRISLAPLGETLAGAGTQLAVSLSVRDSAALLDALAGTEPGDPYGLPAPTASFLASTRRDPPPLRIAVQRRPRGGPDLDPVLGGAVDEAAVLMAELGHTVEEGKPDYSFAELDAAFFTVMAANTWTNITNRAGERSFGEGDFEPVTWAYAVAGCETAAPDYIRAVQTFHRLGRQFGAFFERYDVLVSPTLARSSLPLGAIRTDIAIQDYRAALAPMIAFTAICNVAGTPAASVPLAWTERGLPIGIHIAGKFGSEEMLLALAAQVERARPWRNRRPPLTA
jgi:amidase